MELFIDIAEELFQTDKIWISTRLLVEVMALVDKCHFFEIRLCGGTVMCNRQGKESTTHEYVNGHDMQSKH